MFYENPGGQYPLSTFIYSEKSFHQQPVPPGLLRKLKGWPAQWLCLCLHIHYQDPPVRFLFLLFLGGTDVLFIDLQDVKWDLFECVTMEQCQTMLSMSEL